MLNHFCLLPDSRPRSFYRRWLDCIRARFHRKRDALIAAAYAKGRADEKAEHERKAGDFAKTKQWDREERLRWAAIGTPYIGHCMGEQIVFFVEKPVSKTTARYGFAFYVETAKALQTRDTLREIVGCIVERERQEERVKAIGGVLIGGRL